MIQNNLSVILIFLLLFSGCKLEDKNTIKHNSSYIIYKTKTYIDILEILRDLGYSKESFKNGMKKIPRVLITRFSKRWQKASKRVSISTKKSIFLRLIASGVMIANEEVKKKRAKLIPLIKRVKKAPISRKEAKWLRDLAKKYKLLKSNSDLLTLESLDELLQRVDIVPTSLAVAQAAIESGWGTSRFTIEGNALFGQWSFENSALKPKKQRKNLGNYGLATFKTPLDSIRAYILNLNTHPAYKEFRKRRAFFRNANIALKGLYFTDTLKNYSEQKLQYVKNLDAIIIKNSLEWLDLAKLKNGKTIIIDPEG